MMMITAMVMERKGRLMVTGLPQSRLAMIGAHQLGAHHLVAAGHGLIMAVAHLILGATAAPVGAAAAPVGVTTAGGQRSESQS